MRKLKPDNFKVTWPASGRAQIWKSGLTLAPTKHLSLSPCLTEEGPSCPLSCPLKRTVHVACDPLTVRSRLIPWDLLEGGLKRNDKWRQSEKKCIAFHSTTEAARPRSPALRSGALAAAALLGEAVQLPGRSEAARRGCQCPPHLLRAGIGNYQERVLDELEKTLQKARFLQKTSEYPKSSYQVATLFHVSNLCLTSIQHAI